MSKKLIVLIVVAILLASCAGAPVLSSKSGSEAGYPMTFDAAEPIFMESEVASTDLYTGENLRTQENQARLVIKNASLSIVVEAPGDTMDMITNLANELGGFVVTSNFYQIQIDGGLEVPQANITIRVPSEKLDQALQAIKAEAGQVLNENISGQDVTQEYTDLESRLRNLEKAEEQLTAIMENAWETEDVLSVYNRLVEVQEQIELIKGQMKYYEQSAALSAISVNIQANEAVQPLKIGNWQPVGVAKRAIQALINTLEFLVNMLIWIALYILPVALILYFPVRWLWRGAKRLQARRKAKKEQKKAAKEAAKIAAKDSQTTNKS
jgi:flagellar basal body-associated protein FliL